MSSTSGIGSTLQQGWRHVQDAVEAPLDVVADPVQAGAKALVDRYVPETVRLVGSLPPYTPLAASAMAEAEGRSKGLRAPLGFIQDGHGRKHEPLSIEVTGSYRSLTDALQKAGWIKAERNSVAASTRVALTLFLKETGLYRFVPFMEHNSPMSVMHVDGKAQVAGFEKNNDHHRGRDHLRIFAAGRDAQGRPQWRLSTTRDIAVDVHLRSGGSGHEIDAHVDRERNMVMADLLASGKVKNWRVADGDVAAADVDHAKKLARQTDQRVFLAQLS